MCDEVDEQQVKKKYIVDSFNKAGKIFAFQYA